MATQELDPTGDISLEWNFETPSANHWENIDEGLAVPNTSSHNAASGVSALKDRFAMDSTSLGGGTVSAIRVGCYHYSTGSASTGTVRIFTGASQIGGDKTITLPTSWAEHWTSSWTGLALTQAEIDDLRVELEYSGDGNNWDLATMVAEITWEPLATIEGINIGDVFKDVAEMKINVGDAWKDVVEVKINIGDDWKDMA
jgi:hypothetical protein